MSKLEISRFLECAHLYKEDLEMSLLHNKKPRISTMIIVLVIIVFIQNISITQVYASTNSYQLNSNTSSKTINLYNSDLDYEAIQISTNNSVSEKFTAISSFNKIEVCCPSWYNNLGNLTIKLYKWKDNTNNTLQSNPIAVNEYVNFNDNQWLSLEFQVQSSGEYLWQLCNPTETVGVWKNKNSNYNGIAFLNNTEVNGDYQSRITYIKVDFENQFDKYSYPSPILLNTNDRAGAKFTAVSDFNKIEVNCPSWSNNIGNLTLKLYRLNNDYNTSVNGTPLAVKEFINFSDNEWLSISFSTLPNGEYVWELSNPTETVGVWKDGDSNNACISFFNSTETNGDYLSRIYYLNPPISTKNTNLFDLGNIHDAIQINENTNAGERFEATNNFNSIEVCCPSYSNNVGNLTLSLYKWKDNYSTSVNEPAIASRTFINFSDNSWLKLNFETQAPGNYVWQLSNPTETVGVWKNTYSQNSSIAYYNGMEVTGDYHSVVYYVPEFTAVIPDEMNCIYDKNNRLTDVIINGVTILKYEYDLNGNLIRKYKP